MRPPRNDAFYTLVAIIAITAALIFVLLLLCGHLSRKKFAFKAQMYVWRGFYEAYDELHLGRRERYFSFCDRFLGTTYISLSAGIVHYEETNRVKCYYNGNEYVCFLTDETTDGRTIIDCYLTKPCRRPVRLEEFKGQSISVLYESLGTPAAAGMYDKRAGFATTDDSAQELMLTYLIKGELFLSDYVYHFYINEDDMVEDVQMVRIRFREEV